MPDSGDTVPFVLVTRPDAAFKTVPELVAATKKRPLTYGSAGNGSVNHLLGEMFNMGSGTKLAHVPYRGAGPAMQDLMGGQINLAFMSLPSVTGAIRQDRLYPIAVTSAKRAASFPNIPTIAEAGFRDFDVNPWFGLFAPAKVPTAIVRKINADVNELLKTKDVQDRFASEGAEVYMTDPNQFASVLHADVVKWGQVVKASGATVD